MPDFPTELLTSSVVVAIPNLFSFATGSLTATDFEKGASTSAVFVAKNYVKFLVAEKIHGEGKMNKTNSSHQQIKQDRH